MSFFKKMFDSVGVGGAKVDTILHTTTVAQGGVISGIVRMTGGQVEQEIEGIELYVMANVWSEDSEGNDYEHAEALYKYTVPVHFNIQKGAVHDAPFSFNFPYEAPFTTHDSKVWIETNLDIDDAVDARDKDYVTVIPSPLASVTLQAAEALGFKLKEAYAYEDHYDECVYQTLEFKPGPHFSHLDEIELTFVQEDPNCLDVYMQVDRKTHGIMGAIADELDLDEENVYFTVTHAEASQGLNYIMQKLDYFIRSNS
jgi:sporulation-control protein